MTDSTTKRVASNSYEKKARATLLLALVASAAGGGCTTLGTGTSTSPLLEDNMPSSLIERSDTPKPVQIYV
ncbi:hypothetical protein GCM10011321_15820 [Youhaiella tibetensis]|uniref:Uncharacterized protein n=1 Tax=Paradevosia tibetensis TaxID=1447062 RepID=A0A5B9DM78_9HYPH|nr:hypothetical protein [Youhaiella tibetensis]QEE20317.1 hypothetical protein FNA67_09080 [Youhaiella tibetensis]GGF25211.1 hypothetical protein GCM10011321_15820 [Youhaiella tibetensis]